MDVCLGECNELYRGYIMSNVKLVWVTPEAEKVMMYCARVSSNDQNSSNTRLLSYCVNHCHWYVCRGG